MGRFRLATLSTKAWTFFKNLIPNLESAIYRKIHFFGGLTFITNEVGRLETVVHEIVEGIVMGGLNRVTGFELFPASIYGFSELPALLSPPDIAMICGSAFVMCLLAGLIPAWTAARLEPVEALRHE